MLRFAYCPAQSCPLQTRLNGYVCGHGTIGTIKHKTAIFREINQGIPRAHHDALEFPDGQIVLLTLLEEGQQATVLQLPATLERTKAAQPDTVNGLVPTGFICRSGLRHTRRVGRRKGS